MGYYTGRSGTLSFGSVKDGEGTTASASLTATNQTQVLKIRDWSLETTLELIGTNDISSSVNTFTPGVKGATGSATLIYYRPTTTEAAEYATFISLTKKLAKQGSIEMGDRVFLRLNAGAGNDDDIKFWAYITSVGYTVSTGELSTTSIQFTMDGDFVDVLKE